MDLTRRDLLRVAGVGAGALLAGPLAACGLSDRGPAVGAAGTGGAPVRGGTVRVAFAGGGATETLNPFDAYSPAELARGLVVFDRLFTVSGGAAMPALATAAEPAPDGRSFTLTLRSGVTWHDGSPLTARDVLYSLRYLALPDRKYPSELLSYLDVAAAAGTGDLALRVPTTRPVGDPATLLAAASLPVVKDGATSFAPQDVVGTGPFRVAAFAAGQEARLTRFDQHWGGAPNADELVVVSVDDPQARVNAVRAGQVDFAADIPYALAKAGAGGTGIEVRDAGRQQRAGYGFVLNTTRPLMADPRVRRALRLAVDRQALVDTVFLGRGAPANDLYGHGAKYFAADIAAPGRDVQRARALLAEAGATGARLMIRSADYEVGYNASTELFVEQLKQVGLDAQAQIVSPAEYFDPQAITTVDALVFSLGPFPLSVIFNRSAAYPSLAFNDPQLRQALATAAATTDDAERGRAWRTAQEVMADRGNWIVWGVGDVLSLARSTVGGVEVRESADYPYLGKVGFTA